MFKDEKAVIGLYAPGPVECRDHDPRAMDVAREVAALIRTVLPDVRVEHVGSTSVDDCAGKGIVDLIIPVPDGAMDRVKQGLEQLGFQPQAGPDAFPESRPMRVGSIENQGTLFLLHVHAVPADSAEADEMRFFRSCLRADPDLRRAYVAQKRAIIADGITDPLEYCRRKGQFMKDVLG